MAESLSIAPALMGIGRDYVRWAVVIPKEVFPLTGFSERYGSPFDRVIVKSP